MKGEGILPVFDVWRRTYNGEIDTRGEYIHTIPHEYEGTKRTCCSVQYRATRGGGFG